MNALKPLFYVTIIEAISWIGLIIAMIAKYGFDNPAGVKAMGPIHGTLFLAFAALLIATHAQRQWPVRKTVLSFLESIPPFTGFILARQLRAELENDVDATTVQA